MWDIQLHAAGLNKWMDEMEQRITQTGDRADMMEKEAESLKTIWEGEAERIWKAEFIDRINEVKVRLGEMSRVTACVGKAGKSLADMETGMIAGAKKL